jgi:hypothetical protein
MIDHSSNCSSCAEVRSGFAVEQLNRKCFCISLQEGAMKQALKDELSVPEIFSLIEERCPHLFSARPVFVSASQTARMEQVMQAIESVVAMPSYRAEILAHAPAIAQHDPGGAKGVFFGYDFHLHEDQLGLIEVNTNAGGAMLNAVLARAQHACCGVMDAIISTAKNVEMLETRIVNMFLNEWHLSDKQRPLRTIAIVDETPEQQFLYPEFLLFQQLFQRHGLQAIIADPADLQWRDGALWHDDIAIDLVYNRLTDFLLEAPASTALRAAYLAHAVVLTPHPQAHALFADKRNLAIWTDPVKLQELGVPPETQAVLLNNIPHTEQVRPEHAERLWAGRRNLFFKPNAGFGGRAAYRGDKLTKRVWQDILAGDYIAQTIVTPGERVTGSVEQPEQLKFDLRNYTYDGAVQWIAARTYQGQTTNFRTPGGGFAPVYSIADALLASGMNQIEGMLNAQIAAIAPIVTMSPS